MNEEVKVSLIMPVCNVEKYLPEALESAVGQTLQDIEIICIDDGSTDSSGEILDQYAAMDSRVCVLHQENAGYGKTMNTGLKMARGAYVAVLEPDDFLDCHMLEDLYAIAEQYRLDFVKSDFVFFEGEKGIYQSRRANIYWQDSMYGKLLSPSERKELFRGYLAYCTCLYRLSFLESNNIRFNETPGASYQDTGFWFQTMVLARRVYLHKGCYYYYRQDNPHASSRSLDKVYCITEEYDFIRRQLEERELLQEYWPLYIAFCFIGHRDALYRIGRQYRHEFILHIAKLFGGYSEAGRLDDSFMEDQDRAMLGEIINDPDAFCQKLAQIPDYIHQCLSGYDSFYIYGAGTRGLKIYKYLSEEDRRRCLGFVVTELGKGERIAGQIVQPVDSIKVGRSTGVIIGVTGRYEQEIKKILAQRGIDNVICLSEARVP